MYCLAINNLLLFILYSSLALKNGCHFSGDGLGVSKLMIISNIIATLTAGNIVGIPQGCFIDSQIIVVKAAPIIPERHPAAVALFQKKAERVGGVRVAPYIV
jgi:hypothetical protein